MAATNSMMMPLGTIAPDFTLPDTMTSETKGLQDLKGRRGTLIMFICNHCPYVIHMKDQLIDISNQYVDDGISTIAISSNDIEKFPQDGPDQMKALMLNWNNPFAAYLFDESQEVAKAYQAACTPDIYLFDADLICVYRGRIDASTPKNDIPPSGQDVRKAIDSLLAGEPALQQQFPSIGCNIKWREQ